MQKNVLYNKKMCCKKILDDYNFENSCFILEVMLLVKKIRKSIVIDSSQAPEDIIAHIYEQVTKSSKGYEYYESMYGSAKYVRDSQKSAFQSLTKLVEVEYINQDKDLTKQIESYLEDEYVCERLVVRKKNEYICEMYSEEFYMFLKELGVCLIDKNMYMELYSDIKSMDDLKVDEKSKDVVMYGEFKELKIKDQHLISYLKKDESKYEVFKFYIALYLSLAENAELIGIKVKSNVIEVMAVESKYGLYTMNFLAHEIETIAVLHVLKEYIREVEEEGDKEDGV